jgi:hypothetical protein
MITPGKNSDKHSQERLLFLGICWLYLVIALLWRMYYSSLLDTDGYLTAAERILDGSLMIYRGKDGHFPLFAITISPFVWLAHHVPLFDAANFIGLVPIIFDLLCIHEFRRVIEENAQQIDRNTRLAVYTALLFNPAVFYGSAEMGHPESMMAYFILLGIRLKDSPFKSGVAFGLAQLSEHVAIFAIVSFFIYLVATKDFRHWVIFGIVSVGVFSFIFLPFLFADPSRTLDKVLWNQMEIKLIGTNLWTTLISVFGEHDFIGRFGIRYSSILMLVLSALIPGVALFLAKRPDVYGMVLSSVSLQLIFAISLAPYHPVRTLFLLFCWDVLRQKAGFPYVALMYSFGLALLQSLPAYGLIQTLRLILSIGAVIYVLAHLGRGDQEHGYR